MKKKLIGHRKQSPSIVKTLATLHGTSQRIVFVSPKGTSSGVIKPVTQKWGENYIELTPISSIRPVIFPVSPDFKLQETSKILKKVANLMMKSNIVVLKRIGSDIIND